MKRTLVVVLVGAAAILAAVLYKRGEHDDTVKGQMLDLVRQVQGGELEHRYLEAQVERFHPEVFTRTATGVDRSQFDREAYTRAMFDRLIESCRDSAKLSLAMKLERLQRSLSPEASTSEDEDADDIESPWGCPGCGKAMMLSAEQLDAAAAKTREFLMPSPAPPGSQPNPQRETSAAGESAGKQLLCETCQTLTLAPAQRCGRCQKPYLPTASSLKGVCPECSNTFWICQNPACRREFVITLGELYKTGKHEGPPRCPGCGGTDTQHGYQCGQCKRNYLPVGHDAPAACPHCGAPTAPVKARKP